MAAVAAIGCCCTLPLKKKMLSPTKQLLAPSLEVSLSLVALSFKKLPVELPLLSLVLEKLVLGMFAPLLLGHEN